MNEKIRMIAALALVVVAFWGETVVDWVKNNVEIINEPTVNVQDPSLENKELVQRVVDIDFSSEDANLVSSYFVELADVISDDNQVIKTTGQFSNFNLMAGLLHFDSSFAGKYDDLGSAVEYAVQNAIGLDNQSLTDEKREDLSDVLEAIAWGVNQ